MSELADTTMRSFSPIPLFYEHNITVFLACINKATPPAPDTSLGSAEILITYRRGKKNHSSKKANTDLLINYLQGALPKLQKWMKEVGGG